MEDEKLVLVEKITYEEWVKREKLKKRKPTKREKEMERRAALERFIARLKKQEPTYALDKDDKTLLHEHWNEKYG